MDLATACRGELIEIICAQQARISGLPGQMAAFQAQAEMLETRAAELEENCRLRRGRGSEVELHVKPSRPAREKKARKRRFRMSGQSSVTLSAAEGMVATLHMGCRLPMKMIRQLLGELCDLRLSAGEVVALLDGVVKAGRAELVRLHDAGACQKRRWGVQYQRGSWWSGAGCQICARGVGSSLTLAAWADRARSRAAKLRDGAATASPGRRRCHVRRARADAEGLGDGGI